MFWGAISGLLGRGPYIIWNRKDWGTITMDSYSTYILPTVRRYMAIYQELRCFQQDNAPAHGKRAQQTLTDVSIYILAWPPNSPDLSPIETVWAWVKNHIQAEIGGQEVILDNPTLETFVLSGWLAVSHSSILGLINKMPGALRALLEEQGGHLNEYFA